MPKRKPHSLEQLKLDELSFVDRGGNQHAHIKLLKSESDIMETNERVSLITKLSAFLGVGETKGNEFVIKTEEETVPQDKEVQKTLESQAETIRKLEAKDEARDAVAKALAGISKAETAEAVDEAVATAKSEAAAIKTSKSLDADDDVTKFIDQAIEKSLGEAATARKAELNKGEFDVAQKAFRDKLPEKMRGEYDKMDEKGRKEMMDQFGKSEDGSDPVQKALGEQAETIKKQQAEIETMKAKGELEDAKKEFADLAGTVDLEKFCKSVIALRKVDADAANSLIEDTTRLAKVAKQSVVFKTIGSGASGDVDPEAKIAKIAKELRAADSSLSEDQAIAKAWEENPDLYTEHERAQAH